MRLNINSLKYCIVLLFLSIGAHAQNNGLVQKLCGQDPTLVDNQKLWMDLSFGPSITVNPEGADLLVFGSTLGVTHINNKYQLLKIKASFHLGTAIFANYPQYNGELNIMTGKIKSKSKHTTEFYYGVGPVFGRKRVGMIGSSRGKANDFSVVLPFTRYKTKDYISIGIPFEYKVQWSVFGLGIDGNLNPYLPYLGAKCFVKIGNNYRKPKQ